MKNEARMNTEDLIIGQISDSVAVKNKVLADRMLIEKIEQAALCMVEAYRAGRKVLFAGNGGSAADAQHLAGELVSRFGFDRPGIPAIALTTDTSILTAIGNDYGFERIFERQLQAQGVSGDVFVGISTSGNSGNVIRALQYARQAGIRTIGLTGAGGGKMKEWCDLCIEVPSVETPRIQEVHILIGHILCCITEEKLFGTLRD